MIREIELPSDLELPPAQMLRAGALTCMYETGNLRYISLGKTELVRKIYGAVRNDQWTTLPYIIQDENITSDESGFTIKYTAIYGQETSFYQADYLIEGKSDNSISFSMQGIALADFKRNRIGLCLHHPLKECRNKTATVTRPDGTAYQSAFPDMVSPSLPFLAMYQLQWTSEDNTTVQLQFDGDVFETEDQRNWSDGSYKTYSTQSKLPRPVDVKAGDTINQKITLAIFGSPETDSKRSTVITTEVKVAFPQIGYCRSHNEPSLSKELIDWLIRIPFDHYRVTITMNQHVWRRQLEESLLVAGQVNTKLELVIFFSDDYKNELIELTALLRTRQLLVRSIVVIHKHYNVSSQELLQYMYPVLNAQLPAVKVGYGTDAVFVDVNENRPGEIPFDFISFGLHPQAHAFDNRSIFENLQSQPDILRTAKAISKGKLVCISPITLKDSDSGGDERLHSSMIALWTLISLQNFSEAYSITFYELFGARGILSVLPAITPSPVYNVLKLIFDFQPVWVVKRFTGDDLLMDGLMLEDEKGERLFFKAPEVYNFAV